MKHKEYMGSMNHHDPKVPKDVIKGANCYYSQMGRCYDKKNNRYKWYGAKGVRVKYNRRQFVGWWIEEIKKFQGIWPTISRIDHDGHYEFGNIEIVSKSDNCKERIARRGSPTPKKAVIVYKVELTKIGEAASVTEAANRYGVSITSISRICLGKLSMTKDNKYSFSFKKEEKNAS